MISRERYRQRPLPQFESSNVLRLFDSPFDLSSGSSSSGLAYSDGGNGFLETLCYVFCLVSVKQ